MHRPGTTAVLEEQAGFEAVSEQLTALPTAVPATVADIGIPVTPAGRKQAPVPNDMRASAAASRSEIMFSILGTSLPPGVVSRPKDMRKAYVASLGRGNFFFAVTLAPDPESFRTCEPVPPGPRRPRARRHW